MFAKVVMAATNGDLIMLVLPAPPAVDVAKASKAVGRQIPLATESEFAPRFPDCEAGAMPPVREPLRRAGVRGPGPRVGGSERIVFQAGSHSVTMGVPVGEFQRVVDPTVPDIAVAR